MSRKILIASFIFLQGILANAQEEGSEPVSKKNAASQKFLIAFSTSTYTDILISPIKFHYTATGNTDAQGNPTFASIPFQSMQYNIISLGLEPRYNLKEFDDNTALTLASPVSFGIGVTAPVDDLKVKGSSGFGSLQIPVILKLFLGNGSTYNTEKDFGFNIGGGFELNKIGIINLSGESDKYNKAFVMPCVTAGILFMRGDSPLEVNFKYGFGSLRTQDVNGQGDPLTDNTGVPYRRTARGQTIKLSFTYLMNY